MSAVFSLLYRDGLLAFRQGSSIGTAMGFFLTIVVLLPLALGPDQALLAKIAPGALWIALLMSILLSADRIVQSDFDDGSLDRIVTGPLSLELVMFCKGFAHWLAAGLPLAIFAPLLGFLVNIVPGGMLPLGVAMVVGSFGLSLLATFGAAVTAGLSRGGILVSLLVLPLYVPILIFGTVASSYPQSTPGIAHSSLLLLGALSLGLSVVVPIAAAAALRAHMR